MWKTHDHPCTGVPPFLRLCEESCASQPIKPVPMGQTDQSGRSWCTTLLLCLDCARLAQALANLISINHGEWSKTMTNPIHKNFQPRKRRLIHRSLHIQLHFALLKSYCTVVGTRQELSSQNLKLFLISISGQWSEPNRKPANCHLCCQNIPMFYACKSPQMDCLFSMVSNFRTPFSMCLQGRNCYVAHHCG